MEAYRSTLKLSGAADLVTAAAGPILVVTHAKPDGDAFGSVIALTATLKALGQPVTACFVPPVPASLLDLHGSNLAELFDDQIVFPEPALQVVLDTGAWTQIGPLRPILEPYLDRTLIIDHHLSGDVAACHRWIEPQAAACSELVAQLVDRLLPSGVVPNGNMHGTEERSARWLPVIHESLFVGIASDTGWFRFSNTRAQTHELASRLLHAGIDHAAIFRKLEQAERPEKLALLTHALNSLELVAKGRAAIIELRLADFEQTGALEQETERLIDVPQQVGVIRVIALISERTNGFNRGEGIQTRVSFRSKSGPDAVNVAEIAQQFGGGGHARAAGATINEPIDQVRKRVTHVLTNAVS